MNAARALGPGALLLVFGGGIVGTALRAALTAGPDDLPGFVPLALVNGIGTGVLGLLLSTLLHRDTPRARGLRLFLGTGICGSLTTCSALGARLVATDPVAAVVAGAGFAVGGVLIAALGWWVGSHLRRPDGSPAGTDAALAPRGGR